MITLTREEAQQVLKVLEYPGPSWPESRTELAVVLRYKLSAPEPEPHGYLWFTNYMEQRFTHRKPEERERIGDVKPVYTAPLQLDEASAKAAEWQGLTDEEIISMRHMRDWTAGWTDIKYAREIEAKLKEKNYDKH
jgi:hypothetical protein